MPACIPTGEISQGANDCIWDSASGLGETFSNLFSTGLCSRNADWPAIDPVLNLVTPAPATASISPTRSTRVLP